MFSLNLHLVVIQQSTTHHNKCQSLPINVLIDLASPKSITQTKLGTIQASLPPYFVIKLSSQSHQISTSINFHRFAYFPLFYN